MKATSFWAAVAISVALLALFPACKDNSMPSYTTYTPPPAPRPAGNTVTIANMAFSPSSLTVARGTTVTWTNNDGVSHTSTSNTGVWDTGTIQPGSSATFTFNTAGSYAYHCSIHPSMTGTIVVQ